MKYYKCILFIFFLIFSICITIKVTAQLKTKLISVPGYKFKIEQHEVTIAQFNLFVEKTGYITDASKKGSAKCYCDIKSGSIVYGKGVDYTYDWKGEKIPKKLWGKLPVVHVSFNDAIAYAKWMGHNYDIPTFEQWYAACTSGRADYPYRYPGSNNPKVIGWFETNSGMNLMPIMTKRPNEIGIYDLGGNVCEIIKPDVSGKFKGRFRGVGGSYFNGADMMDIQLHQKQKISGWLFSKLNQTYPYMGFRCIEYIK